MDIKTTARRAADTVQNDAATDLARTAARLSPLTQDAPAKGTRLQHDILTRRLPRNHPDWRG